MSGQRVIALLGRPDAPTDAVEEYCRYLGQALTAEGFELIIERVAWPEKGWSRAARALRRRAKRWRGAWVLVQYTALAWSARGFPLRFSDCAIFTVPMEKISWIKHESGKGCFIPVGANLPTSGEANSRKGISTGGKLSVAVFSITGGKSGRWEIDSIVEAVRFAASRVGNLRR